MAQKLPHAKSTTDTPDLCSNAITSFLSSFFSLTHTKETYEPVHNHYISIIQMLQYFSVYLLILYLSWYIRSKSKTEADLFCQIHQRRITVCLKSGWRPPNYKCTLTVITTQSERMAVIARLCIKAL